MYNTEILASLGHEKEHCRETPLPYATIAGAWPQRRPCKKALPEIDLIDGGSHAMRQVHTLYAGDELWLHATVVLAWRVIAQPPYLLLHSTAGFLSAPILRREITHIIAWSSPRPLHIPLRSDSF
jgi:hypothetical protein